MIRLSTLWNCHSERSCRRSHVQRRSLPGFLLAERVLIGATSRARLNADLTSRVLTYSVTNFRVPHRSDAQHASVELRVERAAQDVVEGPRHCDRAEAVGQRWLGPVQLKLTPKIKLHSIK